MAISAPTVAIGSWAAGSAGFDVVDINGTAWGFRTGGTSGIFDGPPVTINHTNYPNEDGGFRSQNFRPPKTYVFNGWAAGSTLAGAIASRRSFVGMLGGGGQQVMTVTDMDGLVLTATIEIADVPKTTPGQMQFDWQLTVVANDPYMYGVPVVYNTGLPSAASGIDWTGAGAGGIDWTGGSLGGITWGSVSSNGIITMINSGTQKAWPTFTITAGAGGPLTNPAVVNSATGETLFYTGTLNVGDTLVITSNPRKRSVLLNGTSYARLLTISQFFSIANGATVTVQFQGSSAATTAQLSAALPPAY